MSSNYQIDDNWKLDLAKIDLDRLQRKYPDQSTAELVKAYMSNSSIEALQKAGLLPFDL